MPILNWIGKDKVIDHDKELPFRVLTPLKDLSVGESNNLLIEGDNLEALKALMPFYYHRIKCVYIDPPYNTGTEKWVYNDKVNSPQIRGWLNKVVGQEGADLCRHDKWLCMMLPRLKLLKALLRDDGVIFISIDDNELHNLRMLLDDIFDKKNFICQFIWRKKSGGGQQDDYIVQEHEYIVCYANNKASFSFLNKEAPLPEKGFGLFDKKKEKFYKLVKLAKWGTGALRQDRPTMYFPLKDPDGNDNYPVAPDGREGRWRFGWQNINILVSQDSIEWVKREDKWVAYEKVYKENGNDKQVLKERTILYDLVETTDGTNELTNIFGEKDVFPFPKPSELIKHLLLLCTAKDDIILDSFAGSGTTGHAVLELNKADGNNRKFILVELDKDIARTITAARLKRVIKGFKNGLFEDGLAQGFNYLVLNGELFDRNGLINKYAKYEDLASYVYFTETHDYLDLRNIKKPYLGSVGSRHYFLLYDDKDNDILDEDALQELGNHEGTKIVYASKSLLDEETCQLNHIMYKQIPYELKRF